MNYKIIFRADSMLGVVLLLLCTIAFPVAANMVVRMQTDLGGVDIELFDIEPNSDGSLGTVDNYLNYVNDGDYDGTFVHRSIPGFVVQLGGYIFNPENGSLLFNEGDQSEEGSSHIPEDPPIKNQPDPINRPNVRGTIAMAKTSDPDSATSEWFINLVDNPSLDNPLNAGGFTVFGRVLDDGMDIIDAIASQPVCSDVLNVNFIRELCGPGPAAPVPPMPRFQDMPIVGMFSVDALTLVDQLTIDNLVRNYNLVEIQVVGFDDDGDGIIDSIEDASSNGGDANADLVADSTQKNVASFRAQSGSEVVVESPSGTFLESMDVLGQTFALSTYNMSTSEISPLPDVVQGFEFPQGYVRYTLTNIPAGTAVDVSYSLAAVTSRCQLANSFFQYGPTPDNNGPHWYEFIYDGETGAEINNDSVILHYVDGKRGDSDLQENDEIVITGGPASQADNDEIPASVEDGAPNDGDGNDDGICDSAQDNVLSLPDLKDQYVSLEVEDQHSLSTVSFFVGPEIDPLIFNDAKLLEGFNLQHNILSFRATIGGPGETATVKIVLSEAESPEAFFKFGPTPDNNDPHWYEFLFDGETGAVINGNEITLHFVDGKRGDSDLDGTNGIILDPGAPAFKIGNSGSGSSSGGGGCSLSASDVSLRQAGTWWILLAGFVLAAIARLKRRI